MTDMHFIDDRRFGLTKIIFGRSLVKRLPDAFRNCDVVTLDTAIQAINKKDEEKIVQQLDRMKATRQATLAKITEQKKHMKDKIHEVYRKARQTIDKREAGDIEKGEQRYAEYTDAITSDITACVKNIDAVKTVKSSQNKRERFVIFKRAENLLKVIQQAGNNESLEYIAEENIAQILEKISFGNFVGETCISLTLRGAYDTSTDYITGICELPDGRVTAVGNILIQLDENYKLTFSSELTSECDKCSMCVMGDLTLGLCQKTRRYKGLFQQVEVSPRTHQESKAISVGFQKLKANSVDYIGRGIQFAGGRLFIQDENSVFECDMFGKKVPKPPLFELTFGEMVDFKAARDGSRFYIAYQKMDKSKEIAVINDSGKELFTIEDHDIKDMCNFCIDSNGNIVVACQGSRRILLFDEKGRKRGLALDLKDQGEPVCVCMQNKNKRLLVTINGSNKLLVYDVNENT